MTSNMETTSQIIDELEKFQQVFDYHLDAVNKSDFIDKSVAEGLELRAKILHQAAARVLPDGKNKDQILEHLAWCHKDAHGWAVLFSDKKEASHAQT